MAPGSVRQASYGTSAIRIDARRLEVPLLSLDEQRRHGATLSRLHDAELAAASAAGLQVSVTGRAEAHDREPSQVSGPNSQILVQSGPA